MVNNMLLDCRSKVQQACYTRGESSTCSCGMFECRFDEPTVWKRLQLLFVTTRVDLHTCCVALMCFLFAAADNGEKGCITLDRCSSPGWTCCHSNGCNK